MKLALALLGAASVSAAAPAAAATCQFTFTGVVTQPTPPQYFGVPLVASFQTNCSPTPSSTDPSGFFLLNSVPGIYNGPGIGGNNGMGTGPLFAADLGFYTTADLGGFSANYPDDGSVNGGFGLYSPTGAQLFSGTLANPTFIPGIYTFTNDYYYGSIVSTLTITQLATAVPEPATWAMLLIGFGAAGAVLRKRKVTTRIRFA